MSDLRWFQPAKPGDDLSELWQRHNESMELARQPTTRYFTTDDDGFVCDQSFDIGLIYDSSGSITIHLPEDPDMYEPGAIYMFQSANGGVTITIGRNGELLNGVANDYSFNLPLEPRVFMWTGHASVGWAVFEGEGF